MRQSGCRAEWRTPAAVRFRQGPACRAAASAASAAHRPEVRTQSRLQAAAQRRPETGEEAGCAHRADRSHPQATREQAARRAKRSPRAPAPAQPQVTLLPLLPLQPQRRQVRPEARLRRRPANSPLPAGRSYCPSARQRGLPEPGHRPQPAWASWARGVEAQPSHRGRRLGFVRTPALQPKPTCTARAPPPLRLRPAAVLRSPAMKSCVASWPSVGCVQEGAAAVYDHRHRVRDP